MVLDDLERVSISAVLSKGELVRTGAAQPGALVNERLEFPLSLERPIAAEDFTVSADGPTADVRVIAIEEGSLLSTCEIHRLP